MTLSKGKLSYWGMISGLIFIPLFILSLVLNGSLHNTMWILTAVAWVAAVVIGVLIIVEFIGRQEKDILYLAGGIVLILFPVVGGIILLIDRIAVK